MHKEAFLSGSKQISVTWLSDPVQRLPVVVALFVWRRLFGSRYSEQVLNGTSEGLGLCRRQRHTGILLRLCFLPDRHLQAVIMFKPAATAPNHTNPHKRLVSSERSCDLRRTWRPQQETHSDQQAPPTHCPPLRSEDKELEITSDRECYERDNLNRWGERASSCKEGSVWKLGYHNKFKMATAINLYLYK